MQIESIKNRLETLEQMESGGSSGSSMNDDEKRQALLDDITQLK
jgi:hypothetical protein